MLIIKFQNGLIIKVRKRKKNYCINYEKKQNIYDFREIQKIDFIKEIFYEFKRKIRGYKKKEEEKRR